MGQLNHKITRAYQDTGELMPSPVAPESPSGNLGPPFDVIVPPGVDTFYDLNIDRASLLALGMLSDLGCIVCTNGPGFSSPPTNTDKIVLQPGIAAVWTLAGDGLTPGVMKVSPITADISAGIYVTNNTSPPVSVRLRIKFLSNV